MTAHMGGLNVGVPWVDLSVCSSHIRVFHTGQTYRRSQAYHFSTACLMLETLQGGLFGRKGQMAEGGGSCVTVRLGCS